MRILFLGGTQFVGRHMVEAALARGHSVTLFNRGQTNPELFPEAERLTGDRDGNLEALRGRNWDAVVDVNGYIPRLVRDSANLLKDAVSRYVFVSTGSVYDFNRMAPNSDESGPLEKLEDETTEEYRGPAYGGLKVLCEAAVQELYPGKSLILRLGVVAGPHDPTDRVTYWVDRVARGGEVLVPGAPDRRIQFIDARDLGAFAILGIEKGLTGIFNTAGNSVTWMHFLDACQQAAGRSGVAYTWIDDFHFLRENSDPSGRPYGLFPMSLPADLAHIWTVNNNKALDAGLVYRSTLNTARDILAWEATRLADENRSAGLPAQQERTLLEKWKSRER